MDFVGPERTRNPVNVTPLLARMIHERSRGGTAFLVPSDSGRERIDQARAGLEVTSPTSTR